MMHRREVLLGSFALWVVAARGWAGPGKITLVVQGNAGMNLGADGADRPTTLQVIQLRDTKAFDAADYLALQNPAAALGAGFVAVDYVAVLPGAKVKKVIVPDGATTAVGLVAGFLQPSGKAFRARFPVSATGNARFKVDIGPGGMVASRG